MKQKSRNYKLLRFVEFVQFINSKMSQFMKFNSGFWDDLCSKLLSIP